MHSQWNDATWYTTLALAAATLLVGCNWGGESGRAVDRVRGDLAAGDPTTRWVSVTGPYTPPGTGCNNPGYPTVQDAVDAAAAGDHINVCPGTYTERVTIGTGKDNLRIRSTQQWQAVIKAPPDDPLDPVKAIVRISSAQDVSILAFTITGPGSGPCNSLRYGVRVDNGGSADILGNHITQIRDDPFSGCQNGVAVQVGRQLEATTGSARIMGNVIDNYQKNGPTVDNTGSDAEVVNNRILGVGPTPVIAQNGVQVSRGATGDVRHNFVAGNVYSLQAAEATGILLFQSGKVDVEHNTTTSNDGGVFLFDAAAGSTTPYNRVRGSTFDGITLDVATGNQVANNQSDHNAGPGIGAYDGSQSDAIENNLVESNNDSGILLDDADNSSVGNNHVRDNGTTGADLTDGIRVNTLSMNNTIHDNQLKDNVTHDCHDNSLGTGTSGTANAWVSNHGDTSQPPGLCGGGADDASFQVTTVFGWDPNYPWYDSFDFATDYDWTTVYGTIDTQSLMQLLPQVRLPGVHRAVVNPNE